MFIGLLEAIELGGIAGFLHWKKQEQVRDALYLHANRPKEFRLADKYLRKQVGNPGWAKQMQAKRIAALVRLLVRYKAFDTLLLAFLNEKSPLRLRNSRVKEIGITL